MGLKVVRGDIFSSQCQTLVNTVNCVGVMGAGLAHEFKRRYPGMFREYRQLCSMGKLEIGTLWIFRANDRWVLNFPTKQHWRQRSREEYLHSGLKVFMEIYRLETIESIAFPLLGAQLGGLAPQRSWEIMESYLAHCTIPVEVYVHDVCPFDSGLIR
ncbi:macro domain-containing protein [Candidatus Sumerlaeota bacterium]|nr:macro domain-containing protein [Candidatus Sumerlaeota bacterium]